jgi:enoyl-[acyl-carrier protein] reductase I
MLLDGKRLVISGVLTEDSIAFAIARQAMEHGADVILTNAPGRPSSIMGRIAKRLPKEPVALLSADVTRPEELEQLGADTAAVWDHVDGLLHAIAYAPADALGGNFLNTPFASVSTAMHVSAYSLKSMTVALQPLLEKAPRGASVMSLDFDAQVAWPVYDWMGPTKAALESVTRYLARDLGPLGIRVNTISAGPIRSMAGKSIPGFEVLADNWHERAPLGWDVHDADTVAGTATYLFSDLSRGITGATLHVDGGYHAMGAPIRR